MEYLNHVRREPRLLPTDAHERAYACALAQRPAAPFALGVTPSVADIGIAGQIVGADMFKLDLAAFPALMQLGERYFALPAFAKAHPFEQPGFKKRQRASLSGI